MITSVLIPLFADTPSSLELIPILAQATIDRPVENFLSFLTKLFLILGCLLIAFGAYLTSQGRFPENWLPLVGGFILALAVPLMKLFLQWTGAL